MTTLRAAARASNARALRRASEALIPSALRTTHVTSTAGMLASQVSTVPPQPISRSSLCAPMHSSRNGRPAGTSGTSRSMGDLVLPPYRESRVATSVSEQERNENRRNSHFTVFQTIHGQSPRASMRSSVILSLNVSMAAQYPSYFSVDSFCSARRRLKGCSTSSSPGWI